MTVDATQRYQLGLSLSGAISAGAYSAGVLDFLFQALDAWQAADGRPDVPSLAVGLKVLSGASAGAITAAVAAIALEGDPGAREFPQARARPVSQIYEYRFRRLYETWVVKPALVSSGGGTDLLSLTDLEGEDVLSVLNALLLDEIAEDALCFTGPRPPDTTPRRYISGRLHIYLTLANLRGTPYYVKFTGGTYGMMQHGDRAHYVLTGFGNWAATSGFADADCPSREIDVADLYVPEHPGWKAYGHAALASAAFPAGLAPRVIQTNVREYEQRGWPVAEWPTLQTVKPYFEDAWLSRHQLGAFAYTAVDGGVINNDPFEYALYSMPDAHSAAPGQPAPEETRLQFVDRGVIMIAPFPEQPVLPPDGVPGAGLISSYMALMPALKQQVRFKPAAFALAGDDDVGSRFMISPSRPLTATLDAPFPISSGLLNGFGGFVARSFRDHDFQLGRRNCQRFLQTTFCLPASNPIIQASYAGVADKAAFTVGDPEHPGQVLGLPVIPLLDDAALIVLETPWPRIAQHDLNEILRRLQIRLGAVAATLLRTRKGVPMLKLLAPVARLLVPLLVRRSLQRSFLADLVRRDQIIEWMLPPDWSPDNADADATYLYEQDTRAVIGALLSPSFDMRTIAGLAVSCDLEDGKVQTILAQCAAAEGRPYEVWLSDWLDGKGSRLVCLKSARPNLLKRSLGMKHAGSLFFAPKIDLPVERSVPGADAIS